MKRNNYSTTSSVSAKILASDSIEPICAKVFKDRGHDLIEKPGIKKDELLKIIVECASLRRPRCEGASALYL